MRMWLTFERTLMVTSELSRMERLCDMVAEMGTTPEFHFSMTIRLRSKGLWVTTPVPDLRRRVCPEVLRDDEEPERPSFARESDFLMVRGILRSAEPLLFLSL